MPRKMDYYDKLSSVDTNYNLNKEKALLIYNKICREDGYVRIPVTPDGITITDPFYSNLKDSLSLNNFKNKLKKYNKKKVINKSKIIIKNSIKTLYKEKNDIISISSILSGALSFGINLFCIFGIIAAAERGFNGGIGGELFLALGGMYIMFKFLKYANKRNHSKA
jgi:hypothetical protein